MLRNYLAAWIRYCSRNRLYFAISVFGLAVGLCAALLAALYVRNELTYDRFVAGYERTYLAITAGAPVDRDYSYDLKSTVRLAPLLKLRFREVEAVTRLAREDVTLRRDAAEFKESAYSADPNVFEVLPLPVVAGDLKKALHAPDDVVLPRSIARKYFGRDDPIGERLLLDQTHTLTVAAVIEDLPANGTGLETGIFISGLADWTALARSVAEYGSAGNAPNFWTSARTYLRLAPGASIAALQRDAPEIAKLEWPARPAFVKMSVELVRLDQVHRFAPLNPGLRGRMAMATIIGTLILLIACINFVNLLTAQSSQRAKEVGVRKMAGAGRGALVAQFLGESFAYVLVALVLGIALLEWTLPHANAFLGSGARLDFRRDPALLLWIVGGGAAITLIVGAYPAFVLAAFSPATILNGLGARWPGAAVVRQALVTLQFAILIGLIVAAGVVHEQRHYAMRDALRMDTDQVLIIRTPCSAPFLSGLRSLPGVKSAACSGPQLLENTYEAHFIRPDQSFLTFNVVPTDFDVFRVYGLAPVAGALPAQVTVTPRDATGKFVGNAPYVLNETAARQMGFASPAAAVGRTITARFFGGPIETNRILAVVPDFSTGSVEEKIRPMAYVVDPPMFRLISVKLGAGDVAATLDAIDRLWHGTNPATPIDRFFLDDHIESLYLSLLREVQAFSVFSVIAVLLACLGLLALSTSLARRRLKEFGIRKAMGAEMGDIARLLLWQFAKPVLFASLIAWPVAGLVMNRWLNGFAYHVDLDPRLFAAAAASALFVALLTVSAQSVRVARASAAETLRYQ